jgi:hypothetical protein
LKLFFFYSFTIIVNLDFYHFFFFDYCNGYFSIDFWTIAFDIELWITWMILLRHRTLYFFWVWIQPQYFVLINCLTESKVLVIVFEMFFLKDKVLFPVSNFSKSRILSIKRFKRSDSEIIFCRNCFLTSLECRRHHARFRLLRIAVIGVLSSWVTVSRNSSFECLYLLISDWHFLTFLIFLSSVEVSVSFYL